MAGKRGEIRCRRVAGVGGICAQLEKTGIKPMTEFKDNIQNTDQVKEARRYMGYITNRRLAVK
jgi:hypothetical protein